MPTARKAQVEVYRSCHCVRYVELAQFLLELDGYLYLNAKESGGNTFLHRACMAEKANSVEALLSWGGIDVNAQNNTGKTCIYSCLDDSDSNEFGCFRLLLQDERMNINSVDNEGESVLHYAVDQELIEFVKELIEDGKIDLDIQDNIGGTALHHAVGNNLIEIASLLIEAGASFSIPDNDGITSKDLATMSDYQEIIELFNVAERFRPSILK